MDAPLSRLDPKEKAFGGRVEVRLKDGRIITDELALADAHPDGAHPFVRENYVRKFLTLSDGIVSGAEQQRFFDVVLALATLKAGDLGALTFTVGADRLGAAVPAESLTGNGEGETQGSAGPAENGARANRAAHPMDVLRSGVSALGCVLCCPRLMTTISPARVTSLTG